MIMTTRARRSGTTVRHVSRYTIPTSPYIAPGLPKSHILIDASRTDGRGRSFNLWTTSSLDSSLDSESESESESPGPLAVGATSSKHREPDTESRHGSSGWNAIAPTASAGKSHIETRYGFDSARVTINVEATRERGSVHLPQCASYSNVGPICLTSPPSPSPASGSPLSISRSYIAICPSCNSQNSQVVVTQWKNNEGVSKSHT